MAGYGAIQNVKDAFLKISDTSSDTQLTALLDMSARFMDVMLRPRTIVPLTGTEVTDEVKRVNEMWTAGLFLSVEKEHQWVNEAREALLDYAEQKFGPAQQSYVKATSYKTDYLKNEEAGGQGSLVTPTKKIEIV